VLSTLLGTMGLPVVVMAAVVSWRELRQLERHVSVYVSPRALRAEIVGAFATTQLSLPANALENVGVGRRTRVGFFPQLGPPRIIACSDHQLIAFGVSCNREQHAWLMRAIHCYLRAPARR
jgi:hypothetical protein